MDRKDYPIFGELAVKHQYITEVQLNQCLHIQKEMANKGCLLSLGQIMIDEEFLTIEQTKELLQHQGKKILTCPHCNNSYNVPVMNSAASPACPSCGQSNLQDSHVNYVTVDGQFTEDHTHTNDTTEKDLSKVKADFDETVLLLQPKKPDIGNYQILKKISGGGMGVIYQARHKMLRHEVALKLMINSESLTSETLRRFEREARLSATLSHPNIVSMHEFGHLPNGGCFFTMDLIKGESYGSVLAKQLPAHRDAARLMVTLAQAVQYAHDMGIIHRDLKPRNIMIKEDNDPVILDFGLGKNITEELSTEISQTGTIMGTPAYMPPEQARGDFKDADERCDVYSLGATFYEMLTGQSPFKGKNAYDILMQVTNNDPLPLKRIDPSIPSDLERICLKCLEKSRHKRYQSARALAEDLENYLGDRPVRARKSTLATKTFKFVRRKRTIIKVLLLILLLSVGILVICITEYYKTQAANRTMSSAREKELSTTKLLLQADKTLLEVQAERKRLQDDMQRLITQKEKALKEIANRKQALLLEEKRVAKALTDAGEQLRELQAQTSGSLAMNEEALTKIEALKAEIDLLERQKVELKTIQTKTDLQQINKLED